jgi:FAD/FMN-containing dehydrogenase/Fe-S oxidoreductase
MLAPEAESRLRRELRGELLTDRFSRGRYATDASIYQIMPLGVVLPRDQDDVAASLAVAREQGVPVILRGAGTSQNGQPIGPGLVIDCSRHFNAIVEYDPTEPRAVVRPGLVLERLNTRLRADGLFFPVEPSTASRCTLGGMAANNSCGARSIRYGKMVDQVLAIDALLADGRRARFAPRAAMVEGGDLADSLLAIASRERDEIAARYPKLQRRVGGYNLDALTGADPNLAHLLVGSEGTLAAFGAITLRLSRLPAHRVMGVCHFPSFRDAMQTTRPIVALDPSAVELVDNNVLTMGADIPLFVDTLSRVTRGQPDCLLLVEFAGEERAALLDKLKRLDQCMADHGFAGAVVEVTDAALQRQVWEMREACLNIVTSMKGDGKPVSFIEDCAVSLDHLADYTDAVSAIFAKHGTRGTWYAHASVGCLHVRPILNMKTEQGARAMRAIAEETAELVRRFKGSYSGEHGDGISRSEFIAPMFGARLAGAFAEVKRLFDFEAMLNPGKIVDPLRMDDRTLMRFPPGHRASLPGPAGLDWSEWGGFPGAVEMCNNNGACRKRAGGGMCPSFRATEDETHVTRGRANALRLALSGALGAHAFTEPAMRDAMALCVGCKACKRECPTGVDMARMKIEFLHHYHARHGWSLRDRLVAHLPRYAPYAAALAPVLNAREHMPALAALGERLVGLAARRRLPRWRKPWRESAATSRPADVRGDGRDIILFADTFSRAFEGENLDAARRVLERAGYRLHRVKPARGAGALCCGRTFLATGMLARARDTATLLHDSLEPFIARGARVVGLEPSCLLTLRDEYAALLPRAHAAPLAKAALLLEELLDADRPALRFVDQAGRKAYLHGHCHQKATGAMRAVESCLRGVPGLAVETIDSACCGMAGAFGYEAEHVEVSRAMAELSLLPALRRAEPDALVVADGTSCRHQIRDLAGREAVHVAVVLDRAIAD